MVKSKCPNCGSYDVMLTIKMKKGKKVWRVWCQDCGVGTGEKDTYEEASKEWEGGAEAP